MLLQSQRSHDELAKASVDAGEIWGMRICCDSFRGEDAHVLSNVPHPLTEGTHTLTLSHTRHAEARVSAAAEAHALVLEEMQWQAREKVGGRSTCIGSRIDAASGAGKNAWQEAVLKAPLQILGEPNPPPQ